MNLVRHIGDETIQDLIDYIGEEPSQIERASWVTELGTWKPIAPGEIYIWKAVLFEPGIHNMVCYSFREPIGTWYGEVGLQLKIDQKDSRRDLANLY